MSDFYCDEGLLALGIACWFARSTPTTRAGLGVSGALLIYNIVACITLALVPLGVGSSPLSLGAAVLLGLLAAGLLGALFAPVRKLRKIIAV